MRLKSGRMLILLVCTLLLAVVAGVRKVQSTSLATGQWQHFLPSAMSHPDYLPGINLELFATGLKEPTNIGHAGDARIFVTLKEGLIVILDDQGAVTETPFLDMRERVNATESEMGLLGLAFHPDFANNGHFYVFYTDLNGDSTLSRFFTNPSDPNLADPDSEQILLSVTQPGPRHQGGALAFGPRDGYLYVGLGDGGRSRHGQDRNVLHGKILRLNVVGNGPYTIPPDNPFIDDDTTRDEIWALGLRNPWRITFDQETGDLFITDVGESSWEEVNFQPADSAGGENYGWSCYEGSAIFEGSSCHPAEVYHMPMYEYEHVSGNCAVTGGYVYRGERFPSMQGRYFFADFCSGRFWTLTGGNLDLVEQRLGNWPTTFGEDINGELYVGGHFDNHSIFHLTPADAPGSP